MSIVPAVAAALETFMEVMPSGRFNPYHISVVPPGTVFPKHTPEEGQICASAAQEPEGKQACTPVTVAAVSWAIPTTMVGPLLARQEKVFTKATV